MKYFRILMMLSFIFILKTNQAEGFELRGDIYTELQTQVLDEDSALNPDNLYQLNELAYFIQGNLMIKGDFNETASGFLRLGCVYYPVSFDPKPEKEWIYIKEMYVDIWADPVIWRIGKHYVKWGGTVFFNPIDVVNMERDPLKPVDQVEGTPIINVTMPVNENTSIDLLTIIKENGAKKIEKLPIVGRLAFGWDKSSGFGFVNWEKNRKPIYGVDLEYVYSINEGLSGCIYGMGSYKGESNRCKIIKIDGGYEQKRLEAKDYFAFVIGNRIDKSFFFNDWLDGITLITEYSYDPENWRRSDYLNYLDYLNMKKAEPELHSTILSLGRNLRNSRDYMYLSLLFQGLRIEDLNLGLDMVANLEDGGKILIPNLSYLFNNLNAVFGIESLIFAGGGDSEFGSNTVNNQIRVYTQVSL